MGCHPRTFFINSYGTCDVPTVLMDCHTTREDVDARQFKMKFRLELVRAKETGEQCKRAAGRRESAKAWEQHEGGEWPLRRSEAVP